MATKAKVGTKKQAVETVKKEAIQQSIGGLSRSSAADQIARTSVAVQQKLSEVGNELTSALATLENVQAAIETKKQELKDLYGLEGAALSLDELEGKIAATRAQWDADQEAKAQTDAEDAAERLKARKREEDDYAYRTGIERRKQTDEFATKLAAQQKAEAERKEALEKGWANREADLKARETELASLRAAVAAHPEDQKKAVDAAVAVATNSLKKTLDSEFQLQKKDLETVNKLAAQETAGCKTEINRLQTTIAELQKQLAEAHKSSQDVAVKALESASGKAALETLQQSLNQGAATQARPGNRN